MDNNSKEAKKERRAKAELAYRELTKQIQGLSRNEDMEKIQEIVKSHLDKSEELYPIVKKKLAQTSADARHLHELIKLALDASKRIEATARPFDMKMVIKNYMRDVCENFGKRVTPKEFMEHVVQNDVSTYLMTAPTFEFFYGALRSEGLVPKERRKRAKIEMAETQAVTAKEKDPQLEVEIDSTPKEVEHINNKIKRLVSNKPEGVNYFKTVVDPKSFTKTVENIFHTSFLVKDGKVGIKREEDKKGAILTYQSDKSSQRGGSNSAQGGQSILSFSMEDYRRWIELYNIKKSALAEHDR